MKETTNNINHGIGFTGALTILFIALKLLDKISWSWVWVLSPIWITAIIYVAALLLGIVVAAIAYFHGK